jgi:hypothetical protein
MVKLFVNPIVLTDQPAPTHFDRSQSTAGYFLIYAVSAYAVAGHKILD